MSQTAQNQQEHEPFPRKAFEMVCFHAIGLIDQNREYLQMHLTDADENTRQALADVELETARLERTVGEMMDLLTLEQDAASLRVLDLREVLRQVEVLETDIFQQLGVRLVVTAEAERCPVRCDLDGVEQLCFHLLSNALRATASGGTVALMLRPTDSGWQLVVTDEGCGLPDPARDNWKENRRRFLGGAGVGLRLCQAVCAHAGWTLTVENRPQKGVEARVEIPAIPEALLPSVELAAAGEERSSRLRWLLARETAILTGSR